MKKFALLITIVFFVTTTVFAESNTKSIESWQADKFGLFVHWGPVSLKAAANTCETQTLSMKKATENWTSSASSLGRYKYNPKKMINKLCFDWR